MPAHACPIFLPVIPLSTSRFSFASWFFKSRGSYPHLHLPVNSHMTSFCLSSDSELVSFCVALLFFSWVDSQSHQHACIFYFKTSGSLICPEDRCQRPDSGAELNTGPKEEELKNARHSERSVGEPDHGHKSHGLISIAVRSNLCLLSRTTKDRTGDQVLKPLA